MRGMEWLPVRRGPRSLNDCQLNQKWMVGFLGERHGLPVAIRNGQSVCHYDPLLGCWFSKAAAFSSDAIRSEGLRRL